jgi:hypothetical protein
VRCSLERFYPFVAVIGRLCTPSDVDYGRSRIT